MSVAKVVELIAESPKSWETRPKKPTHGFEDPARIRSIWISNMQASWRTTRSRPIA